MLWKPAFVLLAFPLAAAAGIAQEDSFVIPSSDGSRLLVMILPNRQYDQAPTATLADGRVMDVREEFGKSGCYDARSLSPLWQVNWYAPHWDIWWSQDFSHVARICVHRDPRWEGYLEFWSDGKLIKHYKGRDLLTGLQQEEFLRGYWDWAAWCDRVTLSADQRRLYVTTTRRSLWFAQRKIDLGLQEFYTFDLADGSMMSRQTARDWKPWAYLVVLISVPLGLLLAARVIIRIRCRLRFRRGFDVLANRPCVQKT